MSHVKDKFYITGIQSGMDFVGPHMPEKQFHLALKEQETLRKKGVPGGSAAVYRTTDKTPAQFAAIAKKYGGKETPEWFEKQLVFVRNHTAKLT